MHLISFPKGSAMSTHRSPLAQWAQSAYVPESPECIASVQRALDFQRRERVWFLTRLWNDDDDVMLAHWYGVFVAEDKDLVLLLPTLVATRAAVLNRQARVQ